MTDKTNTTAPDAGATPGDEMEDFIRHAKDADFDAMPDATLENLDKSGKSARFDPVFRVALVLMSKTKEELTGMARDIPDALVDVATNAKPLADEYREAANLLDGAYSRIGIALATAVPEDEPA